MKRFIAIIVALLLAVPAVLAEPSDASVYLGSFIFMPREEWNMTEHEDGGYIFEYGNIDGTVRYFTFEEIGMARENFIVEQNGTPAFVVEPYTMDSLFSAVVQGTDWKDWLLDCYTEDLYYGEKCMGTRLHGNTSSDVSTNGYYCFVLLVDENGVLPVFLKSAYPLKDDVLALADDCLACITENGTPISTEYYDRRVMGYFDETNKFQPTLNGRNVAVPEDWLAYTTTEEYLECVAPEGVLRLFWFDHESESDGIAAMNMDVERVYQHHVEFVEVNACTNGTETLETERVMLDDTVPALRYSVKGEEYWLAGMVFFNDCEYAWVQLYSADKPGEAEFAVLDEAFGIYMQGAEYVHYGDVEFIPVYDYMCAGNYEVLIKSGWLATPYEGGFDFYRGEVLSSVTYIPLDILGIPDGAMTDENGEVDITAAHVESILSCIVNADYKTLFVSAEAVGLISCENGAGIVINGTINMSYGQSEYAMVILCDNEGFMTCHSFGDTREAALEAALDFVTAVTVYTQPVEYVPFETPVAVFDNAGAQEDDAEPAAVLNGRSITLPPDWSVQDVPGSTVFLYNGYPMQAWMYWFDYIDASEEEWLAGEAMKTDPAAYDYLKYFACTAFGFEDLDADGVEYSFGTIHDGRPMIKFMVPIDGGVLYTYLFFGPHEIAVMYTPCVPEAAENMDPQMLEIAEMYFQ